MKKAYMIPLFSLLAGAAALILRILQNSTEFDAASGLPEPGGVFGLSLLGLLAATAVLLCILIRQLPRETGDGPAFADTFSTSNSSLLTLPVAGSLLLALSGLVDLATGLGFWGESVPAFSDTGLASLLIGTGDGFSESLHLLLGILSVASAAALFVISASCRRKEDSPQLNRNLLLIPPLALVVRLVLFYRVCSINPSLMAYYVELLALVLLTLAFYRLSSFGFRAGRSRLFCLYASLSVVFSLAALANASHLSALLLYPACSLILMGFLLLRLQNRQSE